MTLQIPRPSFACVADGRDDVEAGIGALFGHASGTVTGRYTHVLDGRVATTVQGYMTSEMTSELAGSKDPQPVATTA